MLQPYILIIPTYDSDLYTCTWVVPYLLGHPQAPLRGYENSHSKNPVVNHHCPAWQRKPIFRHTLKIICLVIANYIPIHIPVSCHIYSPFTFSVGESPVSTTHLLVLSCPLLLLLPIAYCLLLLLPLLLLLLPSSSSSSPPPSSSSSSSSSSSFF